VANAYINFLATPVSVDGASHWPLPKLAHLAFMDCSPDPKSLLEMIRARHGRDLLHQPEVPGKANGKWKKKKQARKEQNRLAHPNAAPDTLPEPLRELDLSSSYSIPKAVIKDIRRIVPVVVWSRPEPEYHFNAVDFGDSGDEEHNSEWAYNADGY